MNETVITKASELECCPSLERSEVCDTLNFRYRLPYRTRVRGHEPVRVEVVLHYKLERCSGPLVLGDPIYSTTLLPGEQVRLFTSDRHSRWSYDSESQLSYRHETTSEESFFTAAMSRSMSDLTISESGSVSSSNEESWAEGGGGASVNLFGIIEIGGGGGGGGYDASSTSSFAHNLSQHAESASSYVAAGVRAKSSTAVGEVERRSHAEGESEAHYESSSRMFKNPNRCHAVTYLFHKINKVQKVRFRLVAIERFIDDPVAPVGTYQKPPVDLSGRVMVKPQAISATSAKRLEVEEIARTSALQRVNVSLGKVANSVLSRTPFISSVVAASQPMSEDLRKAAIEQVDKELVAAGLLDAKSGRPSEKIVSQLSWEREEILPTPGVLVKGCLDKCATCEPALEKQIELELEHMRLKNEKLQREIELFDMSQEYRCCPANEKEKESDGA